MFLKEVSKILPLTLTFVVRDNEVLLGLKKRGFGAGKWNGFGGKLEAGESILEAAIRELDEETGLKAKTIRHQAELSLFYDQATDLTSLKAKPEQSKEIITLHIFVTDNFSGQPKETDEMQPKWFKQDDLPLSKMWADDRHWLPLVLQGQYVTGSFWFRGTEELVDYTLHNKALAP